MAKMTVITDTEGKVLGALPTDPIQVGNTTIQYQPLPHEGYSYSEVEVSDDCMRKSSEDVYKELLSKMPGKR